MNTIDRKYLLFQTKTAFEEALRMNNVRNDAIVFIKDPKQIYTHGTYWDCQDSGKQDSDFQAWFNKQDVPTKKWVQDYVKGQLDKITPKADGTITYTAGEGIDITGTRISAKAASTQSVGGIKIGYVKSGNNVPVLLNGQNQAYVQIPTSSTPGTPGGSDKYYEMMFKTTDTDVVPSLPTSSSMDGWKSYAENSDGTKIVWMIVRLVEGSVTNPWEGPWRISGPNGENGVDGDKQEFIYRLSDSGTNAPGNYNSTAPDELSNGKNIKDDDFVPKGWTDQPSGINVDKRYEWMSMRFKTFSKEKPEGEWSQFIPPVLWSAYGKNGMDGDGVEYIFYSCQSGSPTTDPYDWTSDSGFQRNEYIRAGAGATDTESRPNRWQDDPYDIEKMTPGAKTYVSIRKRKTENNVTTWGPYSHPSLWAYYAKNGDAGIGVVADFDNDNMCVSLKSNGKNHAFTQTSKVYLYNGTNTVSATAQITGASWSDGTNISNYGTYFTVQSGNTVRAFIPDGEFDFGSHGSVFVNVRVTGTINNTTVTRDAVLSIIGINFGEDGQTFSLKTSTRVIRKSKDGTLSPSTITCSCQETKGAEELNVWDAAHIPSKYQQTGSQFTFTKIVDDDFEHETPVTGSISTEGVTNNIVVRLKYNNGSVDATVDQETIYVISDGVDGGLIPAVHYDIMVQSTTLSKVYVNDSARLQGKVTWKAYKIEGTTRTEITSSNKSSLGIDLQFKYGNNSSPAQWSSDTECWYVNLGASWNDAYSFSQIIVKANDVPVASTVVPTIMNGKDGKDGDAAQTLNGAVMRLTVWQANPTHPYNNGTVAEDGVYYLDVVQYGNELFKCVDPHNPTSNDSHPLSEGFSSKWSKIETMSDAAFHTMLVNDAYIKNLTAEQIVVTGKEGSLYANKPVAGVVNSEYLKQVSGEGSGIPTDNGVRIFAGPIPSTGNVANTAFNVDQLGNVKAGGTSQTATPYKAGQTHKIELNNDGSGCVADGKISWDAAGNITTFGINPHTGGADQIVNSKYKQMLYITNITEIGNYNNDGEDVVKPIVNVRGFIIINGWVVSPFSCDGYVNIGIGASKHITTENIINAMRRDDNFQSQFTNSSGEALFKGNADIYVVSPTYIKLKYGNLDEEQYSVESTYITSLFFYGPGIH